MYSKLNAANDASKISFSENYNKRLAEQSLIIPSNSLDGSNKDSVTIPGVSSSANGTTAASSLGIGGTGSGSGRNVSITVNMNNNFSLSGEGDVRKIVEKVKQELVTVLTDVVPVI